MEVGDTVKILKAIASGRAGWEESEVSGLEVPGSVPDLDRSRFRPKENVEGYGEKVKELREERKDY
ncbi:MAG: phosphoenolpyruvate carboxykinase (ATP), partial [Halodesulfurarchaeum sp.]